MRSRPALLLGAALLASACAPPVTSAKPPDAGAPAASSTTGSSGGTGSHASSSSSSASSSSSGSSGSGTSTGSASGTTSGTTAGSTGGTSSGTSGTTGGPPDAGSTDLDQDGLDDAWELQLAQEYMPYVSYDTGETCSTPSGMLVRVYPHPADPSRPPRYVAIRYDHLYQTDCGTAGHTGDDENFAITVDTQLPAPQGIMAIAAISHRNTACEHDSWCVQQSWAQAPCSGYATCDTAPADGRERGGFPVLYVSANKHGSYATTNGCTFGCDFGACSLAATLASLPVANAGEPGHPLTDDLTTAGFITAANGWTEPALLDYDPWNPDAGFGGAGTVALDLTDAALEPPLCQ